MKPILCMYRRAVRREMDMPYARRTYASSPAASNRLYQRPTVVSWMRYFLAAAYFVMPALRQE